MAERVAYADPGAWLDDAARVFGRRIGVALAGGTRIGTDLIGSFIATSDAAALATAVTHGPVTPIADDAETAMIACRIADPTMLSGLPVTRLLATLALPPTIAPLFALMLLPERDARFATLFAYLQDDIQRRCLTPALAERLVDPPPVPWSALLAADGALRLAEALRIEPGEEHSLLDRAIRFNDAVAASLMGEAGGRLDPALAGHLHDPPELPLELLVPDPVRRSALVGAAASGRMALTGPAGSGRAAIAAALTRRPIVLRVPPTDDAERLVRIVAREAALHARGIVLLDADRLSPVAQRRLHWPVGVVTILVAGERPVIDLPVVAIPPLDVVASRRLWRALLGSAQHDTADQLAHRFRLPVEHVAAVAAGGGDLEELSRACLDRSSTALAELAVLIEPRHDWADLVLRERQLAGLRAIVARGAHARTVYDGWGLGAKLAPSRGLTALFSGPSGAGKTLSAGIVARELGLPLYRVDLSGVVSKYIGETEKNLERIFSTAEAGNACLFFDECDALFGKRSEVSDAHDRYANIETSYLLQRLETHRGIVILASNFPQNIDDAFARRIDIAVEFTLPDAAARMRLWRQLTPIEAKADIDCELLGRQFTLSGGAIRNCIVTAAFLAAQEGITIGTVHCVRAVAQEYEKSGKALTRMEFGDTFRQLRPRAER
jgi:hypothetical protein